LTGRKLAQALAKLNKSFITPPVISKGLSRRAKTKRIPVKAPTSKAQITTSDYIYYHGHYFYKGDIVSITDLDGDIFYAQLRGFATDQLFEKSAVIAWLMPTPNSPDPNEMFDPTTYLIGPEEDLPRKMEYFTFVMSAPEDYFYYKKAPYPTNAIPRDPNYLMVRMEPRIRCVNDNGENYYVPKHYLNPSSRREAKSTPLHQTEFRASPTIQPPLSSSSEDIEDLNLAQEMEEPQPQLDSEPHPESKSIEMEMGCLEEQPSTSTGLGESHWPIHTQLDSSSDDDEDDVRVGMRDSPSPYYHDGDYDEDDVEEI